MTKLNNHYHFDKEKSLISIRLDKDDIVWDYAIHVERWIKEPTTKIPKPFGLIINIFKEISSELKAFKYKYDPGFDLVWLIDEDYKAPGWRMGLTWILDNPEDFYRGLYFKFSTKEILNLKFHLSGDFFNPVIKYWNQPVLEYDFKNLKTQQNHKIKISNFKLNKPRENLEIRLRLLREKCSCPIHSLTPRSSSYSLMLQYICLVCGKAYVCNCFQKAQKYWNKDIYLCYDQDQAQDGMGASKIVTEEWEYRDKICHVCRRITPNQNFTSAQYCSSFMAKYSPWVYVKAHLRSDLNHIELKSDIIRECENELREELDIPKIGENWISETMLYKSLESYYGNNFEIIHHARPTYLQGQEYDIYFPELKLAIEYDGEQHERPIKMFGGEDGFKETQKRDREKNVKAKKHGDFIIRVKPDYQFDDLIKKIEKHNENIN